MPLENNIRLLRVLGRKDSDDEDDELFQKYAAKPGQGRGTSENQRELLRRHKPNKPGLTGVARLEKPDPIYLTGKYKQKFVNLYSEEGEEKLKVQKLPGCLSFVSPLTGKIYGH